MEFEVGEVVVYSVGNTDEEVTVVGPADAPLPDIEWQDDRNVAAFPGPKRAIKIRRANGEVFPVLVTQIRKRC